MRENKRGSVHVDWIISAGIFIIYITSLLMFIRPGSRAEYDPDILLGIVEDHLRDEVYVNISRTPIFASSNGISEVDFPYDEGGPSRYNISDNSGNGVDFTISGGKLIIKADEDLYWLMYSNLAEYKHGSASCPPNTGCLEDNLKFGITEIIEGVSADELDKFIKKYDTEKKYDDLKKEWGFPDNKEFSFSVNDSNNIYKYEIVEPFQQANVYVKEWTDFSLDVNNGDLKGVVINVKVW